MTIASGQRQPGLIAGPSVDEVTSGAEISAFRTQLDNEAALALFDYWHRLLRAHGLAMKPHFDVVEIPRALSNVYMEEYDTERQQSRMRLMGETLRAQWHENVIGLCTDDYVSGSINALWKHADRLVYFDRRATILTYDLEYIDRPHCTLVDLALPMDDRDGRKFCIGYAWQID